MLLPPRRRRRQDYLFTTAVHISLLCLVLATFDLNIFELEMVADHLTTEECRQLSEALHMKHFRLDHPVSGQDEPDLPCLDLLLQWDRGEAYNQSFLDLPLRLKEIGRHDLASTLSKTVYHEKSEAVRTAFLDDPFKELISKDPELLDESPRAAVQTADSYARWRPVHSWSVAAIVVSTTCVVLLLIRSWCPCKCEQADKDKRGEYSEVRVDV